MIVRATEDDVRYFAHRRYHDEHAHRLYLHLAETAPNGAYVAKDEGDPVGIAIPHALEDEWYLSELYVEPSFRRQGLGLQLLVEASKDSGSVTRSGMISNDDVDGIAYFARRGIMIHAPVLSVRGPIPREDELLRLAQTDERFGVAPIDLTLHDRSLDALDREVRGSARPNDHALFTQSANGIAFHMNDEFVGYAYVWPSGRIGPVASYSPSYLGPLFAYAMVAASRTYSATWCTALIPGRNIRAMRTAMRAGLKIDTAYVYASEPITGDFTRYVGFHSLLF